MSKITAKRIASVKKHFSEKGRPVKDHLRRNKTVYIACTVTAVTVAATAVVGTLFLTRGGSGIKVDSKIIQIFSRNCNAMIMNFVEQSTPSKPVYLVGTNLSWASLSAAAKDRGHCLSQVSRCANGLISNVKGDVFAFLEPAP